LVKFYYAFTGWWISSYTFLQMKQGYGLKPLVMENSRSKQFYTKIAHHDIITILSCHKACVKNENLLPSWFAIENSFFPFLSK